MRTPLLKSLIVAGAAMLSPHPATADTVADFYRGKSISLYVSFPPGGGYDIYARVLAPHFTRHIPGNPPIMIKNMEGGSGVKAASYITALTPQDGTSLGLFLDTLTLGKVLGGPGEFDPVKLVWIGRIVSTATVSVVWHTSAVQSVDAAKRHEIAIAASVPSNSSSFIPTALNDLIGTRFKIIRGYQGSPPMALAMERGEVDAVGGMSWEAIQTTKPDWLAERKVRILYAQGAHRIKELPDDPGLLDFAVDEKSRQILGLLGGGPDIGRSIVAEPGIPAERAAALRRAFTATMEDAAFAADMRKRNLNIESLSGDEVQSIVATAVGRRELWSSRPSAMPDSRPTPGDYIMLKATLFATSILISAVAGASTASAQTLEKKNYNYSEWTKGRFSEAVTVTGPGKMIFLAGVGAEDENGAPGTIRHKGDFDGQCKYAYDKIKRLLDKHGATLADVVKMVSYLTDVRNQPDYGKCRVEAFGSHPLPAHTLLTISQLAWPGMILEIDVTAVVPLK